MQVTPARLVPQLTAFSATVFGLSYMSPMVVIGTLGLIAVLTGGAVASAYAMATVGMFLTALSYAYMARRLPVAGSAYTYASRTLGPLWGYAVGWLVLLDYVFIPMVCCIFISVSLASLAPSVPFWVWPCAVASTSTTINILGIAVTHRVNLAVMIVQLLTISVILVACARHLILGSAADGISLSYPFLAAAPSLSKFVAGVALASYSFLGFDAVSTLAEETHNPSQSIPTAIMLATLIGGAIFGICAYALMAVHPSLRFFYNDKAAYEIVGTVAGQPLRVICTVVVVLAYFTAQISTHASVCRLLMVMGRDDILPRAVFGYVSTRFRTPVANILIIGAIMLAAGIGLSIKTSTSFINFGAFSAFLFVNVCAALHARRHGEGRWQRTSPVIVGLLGGAVCVTLLFGLERSAQAAGLIWSVLGLSYLAFKTRLFRRDLPPIDVAIDSGQSCAAKRAVPQ